MDNDLSGWTLYCMDLWYTRTFFPFSFFLRQCRPCIILQTLTHPDSSLASASHLSTHSPTHRSKTSAILFPSCPLALGSRLPGTSLTQGTRYFPPQSAASG